MEMEIIVERCAGLDVHKKSVEVCARVMKDRRVQKTVRRFATMTEDLESLADWLTKLGVTHVAMESTGVYWKPIFNILEEYFTVLLCNASRLKNVPGRKTDAKDCEWIAQLLQHGLLSGSFIPPRAQRDLRDLTRHRAQLVSERTRVVNRIQKVLEDANIKLASVATDPLGASGRAMITALIGGQEDSEELATLAKGKLKAKIPELRRALRGHITEHHRFLLRKLMQHLDFVSQEIVEFDLKIELQVHSPELSPAEGSEDAGEEDEHSSCSPPKGFVPAVVLISQVPGLNKISSNAILAEIGIDMARFATHKHLSSWSRMCPGNDESAGKRKSGHTGKANRWLRSVLTQCAWAASHTKNTYFSAQFRQIAKRRGNKRAIIAVAHSLLTVIYHMLKYGTAYHELGADFFNTLDPVRKTKYHVKRLEELGHTVILEPQKTAA
jgi:transposase